MKATKQKSNSVIPPEEVELVIASHKENMWYIDTLKNKGYTVTLYNTYDRGAACFSLCKQTKRLFNFKHVDYIPLPNIAREAGQYLHHMISRKGSYYPYTIFLQADLGYSHENDFEENMGADSPKVTRLLSWLENVPKSPFMAFERTTAPANWVRLDTVEDWSKVLSPFKIPTIATEQTTGAQFMCSKEMLERLPQELLHHLLNLCEQIGWPFAYKLEYAWPFVLDCFGQLYPIPELEYVDLTPKNITP